jgi:PadR family transcriptional regulator PadR
MEERRWPGEWLRGVLSLCVLGVVARQETYGYEIAQQLQAAGLGVIKGGTLYPVLTRLQEDGYLTATWRDGESGPGRKYFTVTAAGRAELARRAAEWSDFTERAAGLLAVEKGA